MVETNKRAAPSEEHDNHARHSLKSESAADTIKPKIPKITKEIAAILHDLILLYQILDQQRDTYLKNYTLYSDDGFHDDKKN